MININLAEIDELIDKSAEYKHVEMEFRIRENRLDYILPYSPKYTEYKNIIHKNGRINDGKKEKKIKIGNVDFNYVPFMRFAVSSEEPLKGSLGEYEITRHIKRWTAKVDNFMISVSLVNNEWETEFEFIKNPNTAEIAIEQFQKALQILYPERLNFVERSIVDELSKIIQDEWPNEKIIGFIPKIGPRPINIKISDLPLKGFAVSNKLDGVHYLLKFHRNAFIINSTDCMDLGEHDIEASIFDCEWDPNEKVAYVFDALREGNYKERIEYATKIINKIKSPYIKMKYIQFDGSINKLEKHLPKDWKNNNDGLIFTNLDRSYKENQIFKYKFPEKLSIDVLITANNETSEEKIFDCYAMGYSHMVKLQEKLYVWKDHPLFKSLQDDQIVELVLRDKILSPLKIRTDKVQPNFIKVVSSTLNDMYNPIEYSELKEHVGGSIEFLKYPLSTEQIDKIIQQDKDYYQPIIDCILETDAIYHNPEYLLNETPKIIKALVKNPLVVANDLANKLYKMNITVFMKTVKPFEEFDIFVLGRPFVKIIKLPKLNNHQNIDIKHTYYGNKLKTVAPEFELITIFHVLYSPFPDKWDQAELLKKSLIKHWNNEEVTVGGAADKFDYSNIGVLVGSWAVWKLLGGQQPAGEKPEYLTDKEPEEVANLISAENWKIYDVNILDDQLLKKTTYYIRGIPVLHTWNSLTYEIIPTLKKDTVIGHPYVICRFLLINYWILSHISTTKKINLIKRDIFRLNSTNIERENYIGIYKDFNQLVKKENKTLDQYKPYKPYEYYQRYHKLREIESYNSE